jgi:hypothetical protein
MFGGEYTEESGKIRTYNVSLHPCSVCFAVSSLAVRQGSPSCLTRMSLDCCSHDRTCIGLTLTSSGGPESAARTGLTAELSAPLLSLHPEV